MPTFSLLIRPQRLTALLLPDENAPLPRDLGRIHSFGSVL